MGDEHLNCARLPPPVEATSWAPEEEQEGVPYTPGVSFPDARDLDSNAAASGS